MYDTAQEAMDIIKEIVLKANLIGRHSLILRLAPQYSLYITDKYNMNTLLVGAVIHRDKWDGTEYGSQKVKYLLLNKVPEDRKNDLTILSDINYFQPYQHMNEVSEFFPNERVVKGCIRTVNGVPYVSQVDQSRVSSVDVFSDTAKWQPYVVEV